MPGHLCEEATMRPSNCSAVAIPLVVAMWLACVPFGARAGESEEGKSDPRASEEKDGDPAEKPRVITNQDLERYGKGDRGQRVAPARSPIPQPPAPAVREIPKELVPPEDRLETATREEMEGRRADLQVLLAYLEAKIAWLRNPFLRRPSPPGEEALLDPSLTGSQEYKNAQTRAADTRERLERVSGWLQDNPGKL